MLLSTQTEVLSSIYGDAKAIEILAQEGFDAFDLSLFCMFADEKYPMNLPNFRDYAKSLREVADNCGIVCNQAHAPFASSTGKSQDDEWRFKAIVRAIEGAAIVGAKVIVVHPMHHLPYTTQKEELFKMNLDFYRRLIPYCEEFGIKVATENMWQNNYEGGRIIDSVCSRPEEFRDYIDAVDSPYVVGCLDVGHTALTDEDLENCIKVLGKDRLLALHVHDNDLREDSHTLPFTMKIDFTALIKGLRGIGYQGDFTFEADSFLRKFPQPLLLDALHLLHKTGRYFVDQIENGGDNTKGENVPGGN